MKVTPTPMQRDMIQSAVVDEAPLVSAMGGWGCAKTSGLAFVVALLAEARPGTGRLWVMNTYQKAHDVSIPTCKKWLGEDGWVASDGLMLWTNPRNGSWVRLKNWYTPSTRTRDDNPIEGGNVADAVIDECQALPADVLARVRGRVGRDGRHRGVIVCAGLPTSGAWWMDAADKRPEGVSLEATTHENLHNLSPTFIEDARAELDPMEFDRLINNKPYAPKGQVFDSFVARSWPDGNLLDLAPDDYRDNDITMAVDFG